MTKVSYSIERVVPGEVRAELERLWGANLQVDGGVARKFEWLYRDAPDRPEAVFLLGADGGDGGRRWVGTAGVGIRRVWVRGHERRAGLLADLAVDRDHRSVGPALTLVRAVKEWSLGELDLAYGFPNAHARGVFKRVGYQTLGSMGRWARVLRHASYAARVKDTELPRVPASVKRAVDRAAEVPARAAIAGRTVDVVRLLQRAPSALQAARQIKLRWLDQADERIDQLWESARDAYGVVGVRSARLLRWRFPVGERVQLALACARDGGAPLAYAVVEHDDEQNAHVRDLFGHQDAIGTLLDLLVPALYPRGATSVSMRYLGAPWLVEALEAHGFVRRPGERTIAVGVGTRLDDAERAAVSDVEQWHLTDLDEDT